MFGDILISAIGPTIANITGSLPLPLSLPAGRHTCLSSRVLDTFKTAALVEDSDNPMCFDSCPNVSVCIKRYHWVAKN